MQRQRSSVPQQFPTIPGSTAQPDPRATVYCSSVAQLAMAAASAAGLDRLNREDCKRTKHDAAFSEWKILVGPNDWQDYVSGIEGAERYRTQNLPNCASCPGVYELGITLSNPRRETANHKVDSAIVVPVYIGQADNVRTRLQQYGRDGSHLENGCSKGDWSWDKNTPCRKGPSFFTCAFSRGLTVVYRWAPMKSKKDAEKAEAQLLDKFDYAWNTDSNGVRRQNDVFYKLDIISSRASPSFLPSIIGRLKLSLQKPKGVKIEVCAPPPSKNGSYFYGNTKSNHFLPQIFNFGRSRPGVVSVNFDINENLGICGVALGHGSVCVRSPVKGRKRCCEHKGMKINGSLNSKLIADDGSSDDTLICGFILENGSPCASKPFGKNKRCLEHKGRRILGVKKSLTKHNDYLHISGEDNKNQSETQKQDDDSRHEEGMKRSGENLLKISDERSNSMRICGATLKNGSSCRRKLAEGNSNNKRCWQHSRSIN